MEIGEQRLARTQALDLDSLRLLHLHNHLGRGKDFLRPFDQLRARALVHFVRETDRVTG